METIWIEKHLRCREDGEVKDYEQNWLVDSDGMLLARIRNPTDEAREGSWCAEIEGDKDADRYFIDLKAAKRWCERQIVERSANLKFMDAAKKGSKTKIQAGQ